MDSVMLFFGDTINSVQEKIDKWVKEIKPEIKNSSISIKEKGIYISIVYHSNKL